MAKRQRDEDYAPSRTQRPAKADATRSTGPGRGAVACLQCRTRKSVCSLTGPACEGCLHRGEANACSFQAMIWIDDPEDLPSRQLKRKVDRLEELIKQLASAPAAPPSTVGPPPDPSERPRASSAPVVGQSPSPLPIAYSDIARDRAVDALTRALLSNGDVPDLSALSLDASALSAELRHIEHDYTPPLPFYSLPTPASLHTSISADEYNRTVHAVLPTVSQARLALSAFFNLANGLLRLVHPPTFLAQYDAFLRTHIMPEPAWLATYLVACGLGLLLLPDSGPGKHDVFPTGPAKELLARTWVDAGRRVLAANDSLLQPTVESIRTFCLLLQWWMVEGGGYLEASLALSASMVSALFDLQLNRDPNEVAPHLAPIEANVRRRIFWTLYAFESVARPMLGKSWQPFDESEISVDFPTDLIDGEATMAGPTSSSLCQAGVLNFRISKMLTTRKGTSVEDVSHTLGELEAFLREHADETFVASMARYSYHRLHRFAARSGFTSEAQDNLAARYFTDLLDLINSPEMEDAVAAPYVLLRILAAAVTAAVDLHGTPYVCIDTTPSSHSLFELLHVLRSRAFLPRVSRMVRRAVAIVEHLLPRPEEPVVFGRHFTSDSASDFSLASSKLATPSTAGAAPEGFELYPQPDLLVYPGRSYSAVLPTPAALAVATHHHPGPMPPPPIDPHAGSHHQQPTLRTSRPALSLFTTVAPSVPSTKSLTTLVSPWIDAAITPSRYAGDFQWNPQF